jgi:hypothetical protein
MDLRRILGVLAVAILVPVALVPPAAAQQVGT